MLADRLRRPRRRAGGAKPGLQSGFTLVGILLLIGVLVLLAAFVIPAFRALGKESEMRGALAVLKTKLSLARQGR